MNVPKPVLHVEITEECIERLRRNGSERIELSDKIVEFQHVPRKASSEGYAGGGCYIKE